MTSTKEIQEITKYGEFFTNYDSNEAKRLIGKKVVGARSIYEIVHDPRRLPSFTLVEINNKIKKAFTCVDENGAIQNFFVIREVVEQE